MAPIRIIAIFFGVLESFTLDMQHKDNDAIMPSLAPQSHEKFFGKDYPDDLRPTIDAHPKWSYPYPKVQSDAKYDADYIKDENNDGGHWKAQMDYDEIKMKYVKQQAVVREAALREGVEMEEAMKAAKIKDEIWLKKSVADSEAAKTAEEATVSSSELDAATKEEQAKEWEAAKKAGKSKELFEAEQKVERAELHLKDCEKAVTDAKAELASMEPIEAAKQAERQRAKDAAVKAAKSKEASDAAAAKSKQAIAADKKAKAAASAKDTAAATAAADKEQAEDETAKRTLEQEQAKLQRLATDLEEAEKRLRTFRGEPPGAGAFHAQSHSATTQVSAFFALALVCLALVEA